MQWEVPPCLVLGYVAEAAGLLGKLVVCLLGRVSLELVQAASEFDGSFSSTELPPD